MKALTAWLLAAGAVQVQAESELSLLLAPQAQQEARLQWRLQQEPWRAELQALALQGQAARLELGELWWLGDWAGVPVQVGRQRLAWSLTETVSPADPINPRDWRDLTRPLRRPVMALSVGGGPSGWQAVVAEGGKALLPAAPWALPLPAGAPWARTETPQRWQAALRWAGREGGREWSLLAYQGQDQAPGFVARTQGIAPRHEGTRLLAGSLLQPLGAASLLRLEWGRQLPRAASAAAFTQFVLSLDREWSLGEGSVYALLQGQSSHGRANAQDLRRALDGQWLSRLQWRADAGWQLQLEAVGRRQQGLVRAGGQWPLAAGLELEAGVQAVHGHGQRFWAAWRHNDGLYARLRWLP